MQYSKVYWINYNRLFIMETSKLIEIALISNNKFLSNIAIRVLIENDRLLNIEDFRSLTLLIDKLSLEDIWYLASLNKSCLATKLAKQKIISVIDDTFYQKKKALYLVK